MQSRTVSRPSYRGQMIRLLDEFDCPLPERFARGAADDRFVAPRKPELDDPELVRADLVLPLPHTDVRVCVYRKGAETARPLLLWLHGGGFVGGSLDDIDETCRLLALKSGSVVVSLDYRLAPAHPFPAALDDTRAAIRWLRDAGAILGGNGRLAAGGQSAGAALVAAACLQARDDGGPTVDRQVLCYPWLDMTSGSASHRQFEGVFGTVAELGDFLGRYLQGQPVTPLVTPLIADRLDGLPPALVLGAGMDVSRDDARNYAARLDESGVEVCFTEYADSPHAFLNYPSALDVAQDAIDDIAAYLSETDRDRRPRA